MCHSCRVRVRVGVGVRVRVWVWVRVWVRVCLQGELGQCEGDEQHEGQGLEAGAEQAGAARRVVRAQVARGALGWLAHVGRRGVVLLPDALRPRRTALASPSPLRITLLALLAPLGQQPDARLGRVRVRVGVRVRVRIRVRVRVS